MNKLNSKLYNTTRYLLYLLFLSCILILLSFHNIKTINALGWSPTTTTTTTIPTGTAKLSSDFTFINQGEAVIFKYEIPDVFSLDHIYVPCTLYKINSDNSASTILNFYLEQAKGTLCYSSWEMNGLHPVGGFTSCSGPYDQIKPIVDTKYQMECQVWQYEDYWWNLKTSKLLGQYKSNILEIKVSSLKLDLDPSFYFPAVQALPLNINIGWEGNHVNQCQAYTWDDPTLFPYSSYDRERAVKAAPFLTSGWSGEKSTSGNTTVQIKVFNYLGTYYGYIPFSFICSKEGYSLEQCLKCDFSCTNDYNGKTITFSGDCSNIPTFGCLATNRMGKETFIPSVRCSSVRDCNNYNTHCIDITISNCQKSGYTAKSFDNNKCIRVEKQFTQGIPSTETIAIYASPAHIPYNGTSSIFIVGSSDLANANYSFQSSAPVPILDIKGGKYQKTIYITGNPWVGGEVTYEYYQLKLATDLTGLTFDKLNELSVCETDITDKDGSIIIAVSWKNHPKKFDYKCLNSKSFTDLLVSGLGSYEYYTTLIPPYLEVTLTQDTTFLVQASIKESYEITQNYQGIPCSYSSKNGGYDVTWDICDYHYDANGNIVADGKIGTVEVEYDKETGKPKSTKVNGEVAPINQTVIKQNLNYPLGDPNYNSGNAIIEIGWEKISSRTATKTFNAVANIYVSNTNELQLSLSANPPTITKGATSTIAYNIINASTSTPCVASSTDDIWKPTISLDNSGKASGSDTLTLNDIKTYNFSLTCYDKDGNPQTAYAQVNVTEGKKYTCDPVKGCVESSSGTYTETQCKSDCKYHCTSTNTCDSVYKVDNTLKVCSTTDDCKIPPPVCTVSLDANPKAIVLGKSLILTWEPTNCTSCTSQTYIKQSDDTYSITDKGGDWQGNPLNIPSTTPSSPLNTSHDTPVKPTAKGTFKYEITCNGNLAGETTTVTKDIDVKVITLPIWREIIPNLGGFLKGLFK